MAPELFQTTIRSFVRQTPFSPFVVQLDEGQVILVDDPEAIAFNGGDAGYIGPDEIYMFSSAQVRDIRPAPQSQETVN